MVYNRCRILCGEFASLPSDVVRGAELQFMHGGVWV